MRKAHVSKKVMAMACMLGLALAVVAISSISARTQDNSVKAYPGSPTPGEGTAPGENLATTKHVLNSVFYDSSGGLNASCGATGCEAMAPIFNESISCPGAIGAKCTYEVRIAGQTVVNPAGENGLFQFLIDGAIPTGGGTDGNGLWTWEIFGAGGQYSSAYSVTSQVKNSSANQSHSIAVNLVCIDSLGAGGCDATTGFSTLVVRVLKP
jgi:hypothetical protein